MRVKGKDDISADFENYCENLAGVGSSWVEFFVYAGLLIALGLWWWLS